MTVETFKTIAIEVTPAQLEALLKLQPDAAKLPQLASELVSQALRESMDGMPGRTTKPLQGRSHDSD